MRTNKEILAVVNQMVSDGQVSQDVAEKYFPELRENKDEIMMRIIMNALIKVPYSELDGLIPDTIRIWLEGKIKQGEKNPADKAEPKFKVGDIITNGILVGKIDEIHELGYHAYFGDHYADVPDIENWHKWTIENAKNGDVLCTYECGKPKIVFILKGTPKKPYVLGYYCYYNIMYPHFESDSKKGCLAPNEEDIKPATKLQRDTLIKAMADAGYTFDFEKKELKKIERKPTECSEWSEEDKVMLDEIIDFFENGTVKLQHDLSLYASWLKSLRPQKNNWRRVTKEIYFKKPVLIRRKDRTDSWEGYVVCNDYTLRPQTDECYIRIKDINNQKQWKPSAEQMEALLSEVEAWTKGCPKQVILESLYNDLKKLREG